MALNYNIAAVTLVNDDRVTFNIVCKDGATTLATVPAEMAYHEFKIVKKVHELAKRTTIAVQHATIDQAVVAADVAAIKAVIEGNYPV